MARIISILSALFLTSALASETVYLSPGHQKIISMADVTRAAIGNPSVADVKVLSSARQVIVTGKTLGSTDLILWVKGKEKRSYQIVVGNRAYDLSSDVQRLLHGIEGIDLRNVGGQWILDGQIYRASDLDRIDRVLKLYPTITNFTRINAEALAYIAQEITQKLRSAGFPGVTAQPGGDKLFLEGTVNGKGELERVQQTANSLFSRVTSHLTEGFDLHPLMLVDVKLMEIKTNALGKVGVQWPPSFKGSSTTTFGSGGWSSKFTVASQEGPNLNLLMEKGAARILSNPRLLCRSGTPASFMAGGEIPIRLVGERTANVVFKRYGIILEVSAQADRAGRVFLEIESKISDLDTATAVDGIPGILEHRVKTAANLRFGDTVVLGGLFDNRSRKNVQKVPFLGHIPILGELFKSRDFQNSESEFLAFLTPIPADSTLPVAGQQIERYNTRERKTQKEIELSILD